TSRVSEEELETADHLKAILDHSQKNLIDYVLVNRAAGSQELIRKYKKEGAQQVLLDKSDLHKLGVKVIEADLISEKGYIRHNPDKLAEILLNTDKGW
ncbi:MAG: 2-phospho-L-lactate transferase CofD family protein, partial [Halanaerobiales bacterium]